MVLLDTDLLSLLEWTESPIAQRLQVRLEKLQENEIATSIIHFEEQTRGWLTVLAKARRMKDQIEAYRRLHAILDLYCSLQVLDFGEQAAIAFARLSKAKTRLGTMDLKIAAIALTNEATLLTRNVRDFQKIPGLKVEDWTK